ncbi:MAG: hypothetical protein WDO19_18610 [Bacteroidota bacterium]
MTLDFILVIFVVRYLRNSLRTAGAASSMGQNPQRAYVRFYRLLVLEITVSPLKSITIWLSHGILGYILYILYKKKDFSTARPVMLAIAPFILLSVFNDLVKIINPKLHSTLDDILGIGIFFAIVWMIVMLVITNRQRKALEKEQSKTKQEEEQNKVLGNLERAIRNTGSRTYFRVNKAKRSIGTNTEGPSVNTNTTDSCGKNGFTRRTHRRHRS